MQRLLRGYWMQLQQLRWTTTALVDRQNMSINVRNISTSSRTYMKCILSLSIYLRSK